MNRILKISSIFIISFTSYLSFSQDIITKKIDGTINAKVLEVSKKEVKYKRFDNLNGPTFTIEIADITMIQYENGTKDEFSNNEDAPFQINGNRNFHEKGIIDANLNYDGANSGRGWTAATTVLFSPILGLIPALACSGTRPSDSNLNYRDNELMKNAEYNMAYKSQASKIKRKRIWRSFGISSAIWGVIYALSLNQ